MMPYTDGPGDQRCCVPLSNYSDRKAEALLNGLIPHIVPVEISITSKGVEQSFLIDELADYKQAFSDADAIKALSMMKGLCQDVIEQPILMDAELGLLAEDRLFWDPNTMRWRYLMLIADSAAWLALPAYTPDEIWSALFTAAMGTSEQARETLQNVVDTLADRDFTVEELSLAIEAEITRHETESRADEVSAARSQPAPADLGDEEEEEEYRPWENGLPQSEHDIELALTGPTAEETVKSDTEQETVVFSDAPVQPLIPGVAPPPPPPPVREPASKPQETTMADSGETTTILLKPETSVLDAVAPPGNQNVMKVEVAKLRIPRVVRLATKEMAYVDRPHFVIGSKPGAADFLIRNNRVISRRHAAIVTRGTDYYLIDLGSRNGVFIGNERIPKDKETLIYVGDVFTLANEKFKLQW